MFKVYELKFDTYEEAYAYVMGSQHHRYWSKVALEKIANDLISEIDNDESV